MSDNMTSLSMPAPGAVGGRRWGGLAAYGVLLAVLAVIPVLTDSPYTIHILILCFIYVIATMSLRTITISGQFPMAHAAFMGIGAYTAALASKYLGWPGWITIPVASLGSMAIGVITGYPFARLRALYYAMGSMFLGVGVLNFIIAFGVYTGSYAGLSGIRPIFIGSKIPYYFFFLALTTASGLALYRLEFSRIGTNLKAIAQSHIVASSVGINEGYYRIFAVGVGCFFAGLAGAGYAHYNLVIGPTSFNLLATLWLVMYVLVGGIDSFPGPIVGTMVLFLLPEVFRDLKYYAPYLSVAVLVAVVYLMPKGLVSLPKLVKARYIRRRKEGTGVDHVF
ncbi:MAG: branched-chain amino acid ABC transporter permease [Syntrophorhabdales bacterium]